MPCFFLIFRDLTYHFFHSLAISIPKGEKDQTYTFDVTVKSVGLTPFSLFQCASFFSDPFFTDRLATLMIAACLAYHWMIYLGLEALRNGWHKIFHRKSRCDLNLFQLGLNALDYLLDESKPIKVAFGRA